MSSTVIGVLFEHPANFQTVDGVAARYDVCRATIRNWIVRGILPEAHAVLAYSREFVWNVDLLPSPDIVQRPKRGGARHGTRRVARRAVVPYRHPGQESAVG
jgi:hypothetical protein